METQYLNAQDGTRIPIYWSPAQAPRATLLLQPALGIQAKLYRKLAQGLSQRGCATAIMEQRGHGLSDLQPGYGSRYSFCETLDTDIPMIMQWLRTQVPDKPRLIGGHSLGGHLSTLYAGVHANQIDGVVHLACAFPFVNDYSGKQQRMLRILCRLIPLFTIFPGYYPGNLIGFGGKESLAMMKQWRQWALTGKFDFDGRTGVADAAADFTGPVLSVTFQRDLFSTDKAVKRALAPLHNASVDRVDLGAREQGEYLGHTDWAKQPTGAVDAIGAWLDRTLP